MKGNFLRKAAAAALCLIMIMAFAGCGNRSGGTIDEPEITVDYLSGEYAQQLITDGAETIVGSVTMEKTDNGYTATVTEKEVNESTDYEEGYYIAETNFVKELTLDGDVRMVYSGEDSQVVGNADGFIKDHNEDADQLYTVYYMGDRAELFIPVAPEDVEVK